MNYFQLFLEIIIDKNKNKTVYFQLLGYWMFGPVWCDVHGALDVLLSTSSIMNLCLISLDRSDTMHATLKGYY